MRLYKLSKEVRVCVKENNFETGSRDLQLSNFIALIMGELRQLKEMKEMKKQVKEETPDLSFHSGFVLLQVLHLPGTHPFIHLSIPPLIHPAIHHAFPFHGMKEHRQLHKIGLLK